MHARNLSTLVLALAAAAAAGAGPDPAESAIARWIDQPEPYVRSEGAGSRPVALGLFGNAQTGSPDDDVSLLRLGLATDHHNVGVLDFNLFYGHSGGFQRGLQFGAVNVVEGPLSGIQLGLLASVCGVLENSPSAGAQASLLVNYADGLDGIQLGLAFNRNGTGSGLQLGGVANFSDRFRGIQFALVNLDGDDVRGAQLGLINAGATEFHGLQLGAINGCAGDQHGLQFGILNTAGTMNGLQFGLVNMATTSRGWQIGIYNDVQHCAGVQIGLANWASDAGFPLLPFFRASF
ncbi:MAG: hypothetical protein IJL06_11590 [Kiritimatiellae bacterium]|nr:hypothetical protein [Kiritimatiellia bacterium]MBQ6924183.1 hypothetical protein [Kiritimatiellia bacterium]